MKKNQSCQHHKILKIIICKFGVPPSTSKVRFKSFEKYEVATLKIKRQFEIYQK